MNIDVADFSAVQQLRLFDRLILAMYADDHLATAGDELSLLAAVGHKDESDRQREFDALKHTCRAIDYLNHRLASCFSLWGSLNCSR
jgi:uncharacterized protein CbrC (UPF0167 family)